MTANFVVLVLSIGNGLRIYHIYMVNFVIGFMNAFQGPASAVAVGKIVPKEKLAQVSGMNFYYYYDYGSAEFLFPTDL